MRVLLLTAVLSQAAMTFGAAQTYSTPAPVPQTTSVPALRTLAVRREIEERFTIGLNAEARSEWKAAADEFERIVALQPPEPQGSTARYDLQLRMRIFCVTTMRRASSALQSRSIPAFSLRWQTSSQLTSRAAS